MALNIGIVGLPNVGKSTIFNALVGTQHATVANYPFCTIHPNRAVVPLIDDRLTRLAEHVKVQQTIYAAVEFVDIAGLVKGAHKGEGLGNQFLGHIRDTSALLHIVRCFDDPNVVHVNAHPEPRQDIETIETELALADLDQVERKIQRLESALKGNKSLYHQMELCKHLRDSLAKGFPVRNQSNLNDESFVELNHELRLLTAKPVIFIANVDEDGLAKGNAYLDETRQVATEMGIDLVVMCAEMESELLEMSPQDRSEYLALSGIKQTGLEQVIQKSFNLLNLISFFTFNEKEARAWHVKRNTPAPQAAGVIHTDFERGFIRAEVVSFDVFDQYRSLSAIKGAGLLRLEGKEYLVQDGDVIYFRFNV